MKTLVNYINEGLISEIILKILDASLSWIGASAKFIGDNLVSATGELWKSGKGMTKEFWDDFREKSHYKGDGMPRNERELTKYMAEIYKYNNLNEVKEFLEKYKDSLPSEFTINFLVGKAKEVLLNDKTPDSEKKEALKILEEAKKKYPKMQENIDKILKEYENKNNKTNK